MAAYSQASEANEGFTGFGRLPTDADGMLPLPDHQTRSGSHRSCRPGAARQRVRAVARSAAADLHANLFRRRSRSWRPIRSSALVPADRRHTLLARRRSERRCRPTVGVHHPAAGRRRNRLLRSVTACRVSMSSTARSTVSPRPARWRRSFPTPAVIAGDARFRSGAGARVGRGRRDSRDRGGNGVGGGRVVRAISIPASIARGAPRADATPAIPVVKALRERVGRDRSRQCDVRALGRHQPGRHGHGADPAAAPRAGDHPGRSRSARACSSRAVRTPRGHGDGSAARCCSRPRRSHSA